MSFSLVTYNLTKNNPKGKVRSRQDKDKDIDKAMRMDAMLLDIQPYLILCLV
jgi:hypothetical protein